MTTSTVHVAVFDTFADWETGYATAYIRRRGWQREPGRYSVTTVGPAREPVTSPHVWLRVHSDFDTETSQFSYSLNGKEFKPLGPEFITAFQRRFRTEKIDGIADPETVARLAALVA